MSSDQRPKDPVRVGPNRASARGGHAVGLRGWHPALRSQSPHQAVDVFVGCAASDSLMSLALARQERFDLQGVVGRELLQMLFEVLRCALGTWPEEVPKKKFHGHRACSPRSSSAPDHRLVVRSAVMTAENRVQLAQPSRHGVISWCGLRVVVRRDGAALPRGRSVGMCLLSRPNRIPMRRFCRISRPLEPRAGNAETSEGLEQLPACPSHFQ